MFGGITAPCARYGTIGALQYPTLNPTELKPVSFSSQCGKLIPFDIIVFIFKKLSVLYVKSHYLEFEEETDEEIEQDIADDPEDHNDNIPYAEESDFEDDTIYTEERKPIPKIIPKKKKAPFNVEAFAKECNAYVVKQERQEEQENLQH